MRMIKMKFGVIPRIKELCENIDKATTSLREFTDRIPDGDYPTAHISFHITEISNSTLFIKQEIDKLEKCVEG